MAPPFVTGLSAPQTETDAVAKKLSPVISVADGANVSVVITLTNGDAVGLLSLATNIDVLTATGAGTYTLCSTTPTNLTTELKGTFFTPTALQVAPGHTMTTGISLAAIATVVRDHAR